MTEQYKNGATRDTVYEYVEKEYGSMPEHLWTIFPLYLVFRRADNKKWYAIIMDIPKNKLGFDDTERVDILDIKCSPFDRDKLLGQNGFLPAYHLSRKNWITVLLDGSVDTDTVNKLIDESYILAKSKQKTVNGRVATSRCVSRKLDYDLNNNREKEDGNGTKV